MVPTQPDSDTIVVDYNGTLESPATRNVVIIIDFDIGTPQQVTALPASAVVLS